jgi:AraC-like DNA-binding protein
VWAVDSGSAPLGVDGGLERVLPTGAMHVVVRVSPAPLVLFDDVAGRNPRSLGHAVIGGARSTFYVRSVAEPSHSVGAQLRPGAASALLGVPGVLLAERHTRLDDVWGGCVAILRERLAAAGSLERELEIFETFLCDRLDDGVVAPVVAEALVGFEGGEGVADAVRRSGFSHRTFLTLFRREVGLAPKVYCRLRRFQRAIDALGGPRRGLAQVAAAAGYADQSHLCRELAVLAGVSPTEYLTLAPASANHLRVAR